MKILILLTISFAVLQSCKNKPKTVKFQCGTSAPDLCEIEIGAATDSFVQIGIRSLPNNVNVIYPSQLEITMPGLSVLTFKGKIDSIIEITHHFNGARLNYILSRSISADPPVPKLVDSLLRFDNYGFARERKVDFQLMNPQFSQIGLPSNLVDSQDFAGNIIGVAKFRFDIGKIPSMLTIRNQLGADSISRICDFDEWGCLCRVVAVKDGKEHKFKWVDTLKTAMKDRSNVVSLQNDSNERSLSYDEMHKNMDGVKWDRRFYQTGSIRVFEMLGREYRFNVVQTSEQRNPQER